MFASLTLEGKAAAGFEAVAGVVSLSSRHAAGQRQEGSRLADALERSEAGQEQPLVLDKGCPSTELRPSTPVLQLKVAVPRHSKEIVWPFC